MRRAREAATRNHVDATAMSDLQNLILVWKSIGKFEFRMSETFEKSKLRVRENIKRAPTYRGVRVLNIRPAVAHVEHVMRRR